MISNERKQRVVSEAMSIDDIKKSKEVEFNGIYPSLDQIVKLAPLYGIYILNGLMDCSNGVILVEFERATWGYQQPQTIYIYPFKSRSLIEHMGQLQREWADLLYSGSLFEGELILHQILRLVGYFIQQNISIVDEIKLPIQNLIAVCVLNFQQIEDSIAFKERLRELQTMIDYQPSIKRVISYSNDPNELIRLAHLFIRMPLKSDRILKILAVIKSLKQFNQENRSTISYEIEQASNYLLNNKNQIDNARSSRWFREMGNLNVRQKLVELKFDRFKVEFNSTPIDSVVIANYIKSLLREMKDGLIPESIQLLLIDLFDDDITDNTIQMTFILLSFCRSRFQILKSILNVCKKILTDCTIDPITPYDLARIVTVTDDQRLLKLMNDPALIQKLLGDWHKVWGIIISNGEMFLNSNKFSIH